MNVLVGCECSGRVKTAFRLRGHNAWSCDLKSSEIPDDPYHIQMDVLKVINGGVSWDLFIVHPPCTHISNMSNCRIKEPGRKELRVAGMEFFMQFTDLSIERVVIENPRGLPERQWKPATQIIQPYWFGHPYSKATCLWLKNLPKLKPTNVVEHERKWDGKRWRTWVDTFSSYNSEARSRTFQGIANAMAEQWG